MNAKTTVLLILNQPDVTTNKKKPFNRNNFEEYNENVLMVLAALG